MRHDARVSRRAAAVRRYDELIDSLLGAELNFHISLEDSLTKPALF